MAKQRHDIGHQKRLKRETFAQAKPRRRKPRSKAIPAELVHLLDLHSLDGTNYLQHANQDN
jgi:hypothetical protein